jgi:hypothetical protein
MYSIPSINTPSCISCETIRTDITEKVKSQKGRFVEFFIIIEVINTNFIYQFINAIF